MEDLVAVEALPTAIEAGMGALAGAEVKDPEAAMVGSEVASVAVPAEEPVLEELSSWHTMPLYLAP